MTARAVDGKAHGTAATAPLVEWIAAALGALLLATALAVVLREAVTRPRAAARVELAVRSVSPHTGQHLVRVAVHNRGGTPVEELEVEGRLQRGDGAVELSRARVASLAARTTRHVGLLFVADPRRGRLSLRVAGYAEP